VSRLKRLPRNDSRYNINKYKSYIGQVLFGVRIKSRNDLNFLNPESEGLDET
jgi:hypothetical protein